ncbi:DNA-3-methyladenine glycosylase 2 family protein [Streptomyces sp. SL13]|uniref:DNA-3-methyladenine glycosylase II n=1 Tax=Streptantibioticus silvisoli TaxID=2705255 RepID=A0AA90H2Q6_9ACTN|nr:DNA-3-methyladenine glycosylase 2 family protein [Streptantibioticus silvisoli]MDI5973008.1 DNA-3-methyladenine glycosylase 2 family protein [Streptantibioticus silvisoli]
METAAAFEGTRHWTPDGPLDLARTLAPLGRGPGDPAFRVADGAVWRTCRTPAGPGTLRVARAAGDRVTAGAWGPGGAWLLDALPALLGAADDPAAFRPRHRLLHEAHRRHPGLRLTRTGRVLESLIPSVLEQKVTSDEAYRAWRLLLHRYGETAPGPLPGLKVVPDARTWALIPSWEWHRAGVDYRRAGTIVRAARVVERMEEAAGMTPEDAAARLTLIPGIGPWTAAETVQRSHGAPDAVTTGDLHLPHHVGHALTGAPRTDDAAMLELLAPYAGQRHRATRLILLTAPGPPRRAPRFAPNDIRHI